MNVSLLSRRGTLLPAFLIVLAQGVSGQGGNNARMRVAGLPVVHVSDTTVTVTSIGNRKFSIGGTTQYHITTAGDPLPGSALDLTSRAVWLYFDSIRPSVFRSRYLSRITVNGKPSLSDSTVRLVQYGLGCVLISQPSDYRPLTVYSGENLRGTPEGGRGPGKRRGSMALGLYTYYRQDSLGTFDNNIASFILKKGYMATFAENADGSGASKVYIAADSDLRVNRLPAGLQHKISFVRVFRWRWVTKKGWTNTIQMADTLGVKWTYNWNNNRNSTLDAEYVPIRQNLGWPDFAITNSRRDITHLLGYNEPDNKLQSFMTPDQAIAQWPLLMQSGLRLGSPAPTDGGLRWLYSFMDKADSAGYRVDFVAVHFYRGCQTPEEFYSFLKGVHDRTGRPLWVTEWNNGANWTNTARCPQPTYEDDAVALAGFLHMLDTASFVERYALYEWVQDTRKLFKKEDPVELTAAGLVYRDDPSPMAYNAKAEYDPLRQGSPRASQGGQKTGTTGTAGGEGATPLITGIPSRKSVSLNGRWSYIVDPYETGFYDYRYKEKAEKDREAYWHSAVPAGKSDRVEFGWNSKYTLMVPGDWNHQAAKFLYYEGTVWYEKTFDFHKMDPSHRVFLYFGAVNYRADVYLNGKKLGKHKGGFTPFNFEIPDSILKAKGNFLVVKVDNKRYADEVPTVNTDWWNYGGITREVKLIELPRTHIRDFYLQLKKPDGGAGTGAAQTLHATAEGWVKLDDGGAENPERGKSDGAGGDVAEAVRPKEVVVEIPELGVRQSFPVTGLQVAFNLALPTVHRWSPETPKLYKIVITAGGDKVEDKIGFRTIETAGKQVLLNGKPLFMRGICIHEEIPQQVRRAYSKQDAAQLLGWAKELGCNMVRLAHYPHDETMTRMADSLGILVWSEIPVYWTIDFANPEVFEKAKTQLTEMIGRDRNRSSIIIWSVGNETPVSPVRTDFMRRLITTAREQDPSRLISAALEVNYGSTGDVHMIDDPLGKYVDLVSFNEYLGWYGGLPSACRTANWATPYDKPLFISETGAETLGGYHADSLTRWSEEYQQWYYREQVNMFRRMPDNFAGVASWILADFRSPKRNNPIFQEGWNNKGLIDHNGKKKKAFWVLKNYYRSLTAPYPATNSHLN